MTTTRTLGRTLVTVAVAGLLLAAEPGRADASCGTNAYLGQLCTFAFNFCPRGLLPAEGQILPIGPNVALFALLGTAYGGDGVNTFGLPDLRGRTIVGTATDVGLRAGDTTTVGLRLDNVSGGVAVPAAQSPFTGLTRCVVVDGPFPPRP
jgi:hypothetical protein